ncbi:MAG TPA: protein kinase [Pyrinomonadaceae bacterium]
MAEREQRLTKIFHSAMEREGAERRAFLDGACASDEELRREVESLIRSHEQAGSPFDTPTNERGANSLNNQTAGSLVGRTLGQYRLVSLVGTGGMGEVYLADDTRLDRRVAIKILTPNFTVDAAQVGRFQQEARAASALNHPNIITVYDINESEGTQYIATEFIEGETLRTHIATTKLPLHESLDITIQIAGALSAAHGAGVVHRDVKPENLMLRPDGYVKVLDFGIAKLTEQRRASPDGEAPTRALVKTGKGVVMGTAHYMSPEQARGHAVDARTDIWSLGVVLYEMVTGRLPFEGATVSDCIASILKTEPRPLTEVIPDVPQRLEWIVQKALRKDADERYQKAKELLSDLRAVKPEVETSAHTLRPGSQSSAVSSGGQVAAATTDDKSLTPTAVTVRTTSSAEYLVTEIKRHKRGIFMVMALLVAAAAGVGLAFYNFTRALKSAQPSIFQNVTVSRVTTSGRAKEANISPDGRSVVYVEEDDAGNLGIVLRQTATGNTLQIVPPSKTRIWGTAFSPDSDFVYYLANDLSSEVTSLYRVPSIGGAPNKVLADIDSPITFSPDGRRLAFIREERAVKFDLIIANVDGTGERVLAKRDGFDFFEEEGPSWSPDGKTIASSAGAADQVTGEVSLMLLGIDAETGGVRELTQKRWAGTAGRVVWMPDGHALALIASDGDADRSQLWSVSYPSGATSRITNDVQSRDDRSLGVTADGRTLISVVTQSLSRIEIVPREGDTGRNRRLSTADANRDGLNGVAWMPDGRIVFSSSEGGHHDIWMMNGDGTDRKRLTSDAFWDAGPVVSTDGRYIVFASNRALGGAITQIWRMNSDGTNPIQLTKTEDGNPDISPDGRWVIYSSWAPGPQGVVTGETLWKVSIDGGTPVQLADYTVQLAEFSPDGNWIVGIVFDDQVTPKRFRNAIISASGGEPVKQFDRPNYTDQFVRWTRDGKHLSYIGPPAIPSNIWLQPVTGGQPRQMTDYKTESIFRHAWSKDGKSLAVVRGNATTDVVLMRDNR